MNNNKINKKQLITSIVLLLGLIILITTTSLISNKKSKIVKINNLNSYLSLPANDKNILEESIYEIAITQNSINNIKNKSSYKGEIRNGTYSPQSSYTSTFIVDIKELKYSFEISYSWQGNEDIINSNAGNIKFYCLSEEEMVFPDFNCQNNPYISTKDNSEDILSLNLVISNFCWGVIFNDSTSKSGYKIHVIYHPKDEDYEKNSVNSSLKTCEKDVQSVLLDNNYEISDFSFESEIKQFYGY